MKLRHYLLPLLMLGAAAAQAKGLLPPPPDSLLHTEAQDALVCAGSKTKIQVSASEPGVSYQLLAGGLPFGTAQTGNGGELLFLTDLLFANTTFTVMATDASGSVTLPEVAVEVDAVEASYYAINESPLKNDGTIEICVSKGIPPFAIISDSDHMTIYPTSGGEDCLSGFHISGLAEGTYNFTITDAEGCSTQFSQAVAASEECSGFKLNTINPKQGVSCKGGSDGILEIMLDAGTLDKVEFIVVDVGNGVPPQKFTKDDIGAGTVFVQNLPEGKYNVVLIDDKGCQVEYHYNPVTITGAFHSLSVQGTASNATTIEGTNGSASFCVNGGGGNYQFSLSPAVGTLTDEGATTDCLGSFSAEDLPTGDYWAVVSDMNGCTDSVAFTINDPTCTLAIDTIEMDSVCLGGTGNMSVTISGGAAPYSISTDGGNTFIATQTNTTFVLVGLEAETSYDIVVKDANGCKQQNASHAMLPLRDESVSLSTYTSHVTNHNGSDGQIRVCLNDGLQPYSFSMSPAAGNIATGLGNGSCDSLIVIRNLPAGTYQLSASDGNGCSITESVTVLQPTCANFSLDLQSIMGSRINCYNDETGTISVSVQGGTAPYHYGLSGTSPVTSNDVDFVYNGLDTGSYYLVVTDANGCLAPSRDTVKIMEPVALTSTFNIVPACPGQTNGIICLSPSGGTEAMMPPPYTYSMFDSDDNEITVVYGDTLCGGRFYAAGLGKGTYFASLVDSMQCVSHGMVTMDEQAVEVNTSVQPTCQGFAVGSATASASGYGTLEYVWANGAETPSISNLGAGDYYVTATDARGCSAIDTAIVALYQLALSFTPSPTCPEQARGSLGLSVQNATAPLVFAWSNGSTQQNLVNVLPGNYMVTITDAKGCVNTGVGTVGSYNVSVDLTPTPTCDGTSNGRIATSTNNGISPYTFLWSNGATTSNLNGLPAGAYMVTVSDVNNCMATESATIESYQVILNLDAQGTCESTNGGSIDLSLQNATTPVSFNWSNGATTEDVAGLAAGSYSVSVTDALNCTATGSATVQQFASPSVTASGDATLIFGENGQAQLGANVTGGTSPYQYSWSPTTGLDDPGSVNPIASPNATTTYMLLVTDANGCTDQDEVLVEVIFIRVPSGFTPNGDDKNSQFKAYIPNTDVTITKIQIFDRWGKMVYDASGNEGWDGKFNGKDQPMGTYVYYLQYKSELGRTGTLKGYFTLLR